MTDRDLLRRIIYLTEWTQTDLAERLGFDRSNISRVIRGKQTLPQPRREAAEQLLADFETKNPRQTAI